MHYCTSPVSRFLCRCYLLCVLAGCAGGKNYNPKQKFAPEALQQDVSLLRNTYETCHPSLYWYSSKPTLDSAFDALHQGLTDSLTEQQFRMRLAKAVALISCGHTSVKGSKAASKYTGGRKQPIFPLQVKVWNGDSMVVLANANRGVSPLKRGTIVTAINGKSIAQLLDSLCSYISTDGLHRNYQYQLLSNNFPSWYKAVFGLSTAYQINYIDAVGQPNSIQISNFDPRYEDSLRQVQATKRPTLVSAKPLPPPKATRNAQIRKLIIDTAQSLAIMELNSFTGGHLRQFFKQSFKTIANLQLSNLAIELRENGGGNINNNIRLTRYLSNHAFKIADTVAAKSFRYPNPLAVKNGIPFWIERLFTGTRKADGRIHYRHYENRVFKPYANNHFDGKVFIITGGLTFSASILFAAPLLNQANVLTLGEETGGGWYGNSAVNIPIITLPNTHVRASLPMYRLVIYNNIEKKGSGIVPKIAVPPTSWHLANRLDPKMMKVYALLDKPK